MNHWSSRGAKEFRNEFAWSVTRRRNFDECRRRYYFAHYAHWNGWRADAPEKARRCYVLGKMTTLPMWAGQVVHETIEDALRTLRDQWPRRRAPHLDALRDAARTRLRRGWKASRDRQWERDPKRNANLFEHYFGLDIPRERADRIAAHVYGCIERFLASDVLRTILGTDPLNWLCVEEFERFDLGEVRAVVRLDVALRDGPHVVVVDWKTGRPQSFDREQLLTYALAAVALWNVAVENVRLRPVYLATGECPDWSVTAEEAREARGKVGHSCREMAALLEEGDIERNEPLPEEAFARTDDCRVCTRCNFQELCFAPNTLPVHTVGSKDSGAPEEAD